ncbi:MAG: sigma-70 family RNA polymerase sigma factor [FCB group bacterium]|jgi:RNA polymerase sigma-70 factor (ECF subfamily)|nr:sigma-70 family RNA polymerase sigma factor [FCB group bacterium]
MQDSELIAAVRAGDREAYGVLVERHRASVYALCRRMAGNAPDAEDLAHQAFVEAWLKLHQLRDPERFGGWLRMLVLNLCRMWYRKRKQDSTVALNDTDAPAPDAAADASLRAQVALGLTRLPAPHRMVLVLHYLEGLSYKELARFLDVPSGTVMSRLYRARTALRGVLDEMAEEEEERTMSKDEDFAREINAEIGVLLRLGEGERRKAERLSAVLQKSPERLGRLIREGDDALLEDLACLMPRLGSEAVRVALDLFASGMPDDRVRAQRLLERSLAGLKSRAIGPEGSSSGAMPPRYAYVLLDALIITPLPAESRTDLLLGLLEASEEEGTSVLLVNLLLCEPGAAFPKLMECFLAEDATRAADVLHALCRTGAPFAEALQPLLRSGDPRQVKLALAGAEALARSRDPEDLRDASPLRIANEIRTRRKWAPLNAERLSQTTASALAAQVAALVDDDSAVIREATLRILGLLKDPAQRDLVRRAAAHADAQTRAAALRALGEMADTDSLELPMRGAESKDVVERLAAVEVLARLKTPQARPVFMRLLTDSEAKVRAAAISALGELGEEADRAALQPLLTSPDRATARAAAMALYSAKKPTPRAPSETSMKRLERANMAANPVTGISIDAALRYALPEPRTYGHRELTERLATVCGDFSATRRYAVEEGVFERVGDEYHFTELGKAAWRVERFVVEHYLKEC